MVERRYVMKKLLSWLFVLVILTSLFTPFALADASFYWRSNSSSITIKDASFGTSGDSEHAKVFFVESDGNAKITFEQKKGKASEGTLSLQFFEGLLGDAEEWGKYEISVVHADTGKKIVYQWNDTYLSSSFTIKFSSIGHYYVHIRPYTADEMTDAFKATIFNWWEVPAEWWIDSKRNCSVSASSPFANSGSDLSHNTTVPQPKYATVTVIHKLVDNGQELRRENKQLAPGTHTLYADYPVGNVAEVYGSSSRIVAVGSNGVADTNTVVFQYKLLKKDNPQNDPTSDPTDPPYKPPVQSGNAYDIGIPNLNGNVYYQDDMNVHVLWVHYQLKATGVYYQGDSWDETGNLGDRTMREIGKFMQDNGYRNHDGHVDQTVINTLANYLGSRRVPVYVGGFYEKMNTIMTGGSEGSMQKIDANSSSIRIKWVQTCLSKLGYYNSSIDGRFGPGTTRALNHFQAEHGYLQRDYVSLGVARSLIEACYNAGCNLNDLP